MFDTAFVDPTARRFIFPANDSSLAVFGLDSNGVWVKGADPTKEDQQWSIGITPVRMPFNGGSVQAGHGFSLAEEGSASGDPKGTLVGGVERVALRNVPIIEEDGEEKELKNVENANTLVHGHRRKFYCDTNYIKGELKFFLSGDDSTINKVKFSQDGNIATLIDTAVFTGLTVGLKAFTMGILTSIHDDQQSSKRICLKEANREQYVEEVCDGINPVAINIETENWVKPKGLRSGKVVIKWEKGMRVYRSQVISDDNLLWPPKSKKDEVKGMHEYKKWSNFRDDVLKEYTTVYALSRQLGVSTLSINFFGDKKNKASYIYEELKLIQPKVTMKTNDGFNVSTKPHELFDAKSNEYVVFKVEGYESESDHISTISLEINYDDDNDDHVNFYNEQVVKEMSREYNGAGGDYAFEWDGRDKFDNRILLAGNYTVKATIETNNGKSVEVAYEFGMTTPNFVSYGVDNEQPDIVDYDIMKMRSMRDNNEFDWAALPFLNTNDFRDFSWLSNFAEAQDFAYDLSGYNTYDLSELRDDNKKKKIGAENLLEELQKDGASLRFMGHHTLSTLNDGEVGSALLKDSDGNAELLHANCPQNAVICTDVYNSHCMNIKCNNENRGERYLDDVLFAILIGCRTAAGDYSTAQSYFDKGVDCVLGTRKRKLVLFLILFNRFLGEELLKNKKISVASIDAYEKTIEHMIRFIVSVQTRDALFSKFTRNGVRWIDEYDNTFTLLGEDINVLPARYGETLSQNEE